MQFKKLQHYEWLTLIDSMYKTNKYNWCFFTLYIHDEYRFWNTGRHFFVSKEDSETIVEALKIIRTQCHCWSPQYALLDQNSAEANNIKQAFSSLLTGEQECEVILCVVHVIQTWMSKIYDKKT